MVQVYGLMIDVLKLMRCSRNFQTLPEKRYVEHIMKLPKIGW